MTGVALRHFENFTMMVSKSFNYWDGVYVSAGVVVRPGEVDVAGVGGPKKWKKANIPIPLTCSVDWIFKVVSIDMFLCIHIGGGYLWVPSKEVW